MTSWLRQAPSPLREVTLQRTMEKLVELVESYLASSFCTLLHTTSIEFSCVSDPQTVCVHSNQVQRFHARISALWHWNILVDTLRMYPINLFTSRSQHKIFGADTHRCHHPGIFLLLSRFDHTQEVFLVLILQSLELNAVDHLRHIAMSCVRAHDKWTSSSASLAMEEMVID